MTHTEHTLKHVSRPRGLLDLRHRFIFLLALLLQVLAVYYLSDHGLRHPLYAISYALLASAFARNLKVPGVPLITLGFILNLMAMTANGGLMPVTPETLAQIGRGDELVSLQEGDPVTSSKGILISRGHSRLWLLTDVIVLPFNKSQAVSIGDLLMVLGCSRTLTSSLSFLFLSKILYRISSLAATRESRSNVDGP